jgi:hypothetical protein
MKDHHAISMSKFRATPTRWIKYPRTIIVSATKVGFSLTATCVKFIASAHRLCILKRRREFFARAQKQGFTSCSSADENGFGLPIMSNLATSKRRGGPVLKSSLVSSGATQSETRSHREMPRSGKKQNHRAKARKSFEG